MRHAQVLVYENDSRLTAALQPLAARRRWVLRHPRTLAECLELLRAGGPAALVLRIGRHLEVEMDLLAGVSRLCPDVGLVVLGEPLHAPLAGLAWDLGADYVAFLPQPPELLPAVVEGLVGGEDGA
jgi:hypothetical protein